jgi:O-antigen/teichoic acid export membrane protein
VPFAFAVGLESFYIVSNRVRAWIGLTVIGAIITIPTNVLLILKVPYTGTAWGLSLYQSWVLVHLCYATWFLTRKARRGGVWALEHEQPGDGGAPRLEASGAAE